MSVTEALSSRPPLAEVERAHARAIDLPEVTACVGVTLLAVDVALS